MSPSQDLRELPLGLIEPNLAQPRRHFDEDTLQELAARSASAVCCSRCSCVRVRTVDTG